MRAAPALLALLAAAAVQAAPPTGVGEHGRLATQVQRLDRAVDQQQVATRKLHEKVHMLEQAQQQDAARLQARDRTIEALRRQLQAAQQKAAAPADRTRQH